MLARLARSRRRRTLFQASHEDLGWIVSTFRGSGPRAAVGALVAMLVVLGSLTLGAGSASATDAHLFQAGDIIDDATFFNPGTMSEGDIQTFLNSRETGCAPVAGAPACLKNYVETTHDIAGTPMCDAYTGAPSESAARIIYKVAHDCRINPQVLLVMLQKEEGLVTSAAPSLGQYQQAMGAGCPDTSGCDANYYGFFNQVHYGAYLMQRYTMPPGTGPGTSYPTRYDLIRPVGQVSAILYSPNCTGTKDVYVANQATHSLYLYTPYTPNQNSLDAQYGAVSPPDVCATYGNRNFFLFFSDWFGSGRASIAGTVHGEHAGPLANVVVHAMDEGGTLRATAYTDASGHYLLSHLDAGTYQLQFDRGPNTDYANGWWDGAFTRQNAAPIALTAGQAVGSVDATLERPTFADVPDPASGFYASIEWMATSGISTGTPQASGKPLFKPSDAVSRQAMAQFLLRLSGATFEPPAEPTFADVPTNHPFYLAIEWMAAQGISTGTPQPEGKPLFKPADPVSRQAMASFLARYAHADTSIPPTQQSFADVPLDAPTAAAIAWMAETGISTGTSQGVGLPLFKPADPVSRQATSLFLFRAAAL